MLLGFLKETLNNLTLLYGSAGFVALYLVFASTTVSQSQGSRLGKP